MQLVFTLIEKWIERSLERNCDESLAMSLLEILHSSCSSCVFRMFFIFEKALKLKFDDALID